MLRLNNIEVIYSDVILVLKGVSLEVAPGKIVALLGANGAWASFRLRSSALPFLLPRVEVLGWGE